MQAFIREVETIDRATPIVIMLLLKYGTQNANSDVCANASETIKCTTDLVVNAITLKNKNPIPPQIFSTMFRYSLSATMAIPNSETTIFIMKNGYTIDDIPATTNRYFNCKLL